MGFNSGFKGLMQLNQWTLHCDMPFYTHQHIFKYLLLQSSMAKWRKTKSHTFLKSVYVLETNAKNRQMVWSTDYARDIFVDWPLQQITEYFVITLSNHTNRIRYFRKIKLDKHVIQHRTFALPNMFIFACLSNNGETRVLDVTEYNSSFRCHWIDSWSKHLFASLATIQSD